MCTRRLQLGCMDMGGCERAEPEAGAAPGLDLNSSDGVEIAIAKTLGVARKQGWTSGKKPSGYRDEKYFGAGKFPRVGVLAMSRHRRLGNISIGPVGEQKITENKITALRTPPDSQKEKRGDVF